LSLCAYVPFSGTSFLTAQPVLACSINCFHTCISSSFVNTYAHKYCLLNDPPWGQGH
jgi:hypothetical protein